jgi:hypothetical protein
VGVCGTAVTKVVSGITSSVNPNLNTHTVDFSVDWAAAVPVLLFGPVHGTTNAKQRVGISSEIAIRRRKLEILSASGSWINRDVVSIPEFVRHSVSIRVDGGVNWAGVFTPYILAQENEAEMEQFHWS